MEIKNLRTVVIDQTREYKKVEIFADLFIKDENIAKVRLIVFLTAALWDGDKDFFIKDPEFDVKLNVLVPNYNSKIGFCSAANIDTGNSIRLSFAYYKQLHIGGNHKLVECGLFHINFDEQGDATCYKLNPI